MLLAQGATLSGARLAVGVLALGLMALEFLLARRSGRSVYDRGETVASLAIAAIGLLARPFELALVAWPINAIYAHRLFDLPLDAGGVAGLFLASEFFYYWQHRAGHRIAWLWASHSVHHSPERLNFSAAVRLGWTGALSGQFLFLLPLVWLGWPPVAVLAMFGANLVYQFFLHADTQRRFGPLEAIFNTPAHHRLHHGVEPFCLDRNYGGVLILFDRLFGSYAEAPRGEPKRFGVLGAPRSDNPLTLNFREWRALFRRAAARKGLGALAVLFGPPAQQQEF